MRFFSHHIRCGVPKHCGYIFSYIKANPYVKLNPQTHTPFANLHTHNQNAEYCIWPQKLLQWKSAFFVQVWTYIIYGREREGQIQQGFGRHTPKPQALDSLRSLEATTKRNSIKYTHSLWGFLALFRGRCAGVHVPRHAVMEVIRVA